MNKQAAMVTAVLAVLSVLGVTQNKPGLQETFQWMQNTLAPNGLTYMDRNGYSYHAIPDGAGHHWTELITNISYDGCHVQVSKDLDVLYSTGHFVYQEKDSFNLADIDPTTATPGDGIPDGLYNEDLESKVISLRTTDDRKVIQCQEKNIAAWDSKGLPVKDFKPDSGFNAKCLSAPYNEQELRFKTPEYTARFAKALRYAVELCGGKASAF
jgi:hypothetical protein